ncbi:MAG: tetratricopeptide repeat protein [Fusobacteriaceae bacterium]|jgi:Flp pilus assembly protein TadD|nr:tetratricopeptide repeat protein [Fusobacteriaceae bacterium]
MIRKLVFCIVLLVLAGACTSTGGGKGKKLETGDYAFIRGMNLYEKDQKHEALDEYLKAYRKTPKNATLVREIALLYGEFGDYDHALEYFQKAEKLEPGDRNTLENLGYLYHKKGDNKKAAATFARIPGGSRAAIENILREGGAEDDSLYALLTRLYLNVGEKENARNSFRLVSDRYQGTEDYKELAVLTHRP